MDLQVLKTPRLRLEPLKESHTERLFQLYQDPTLYRWIFKDPPESLESFREGVHFLEKRLSRDQSEYWLNELGGEICNIDEIYVHPNARNQGHGGYKADRRSRSTLHTQKTAPGGVVKTWICSFED